MDAFNQFVDYFMDFNKVRKFQELCGLSEIKNDDNEKVDTNVGLHCSPKDANQASFSTELRERHIIDSKNKSTTCCGEEKSKKKPSVTYQVNNKFLHHLFLLGSMLGTEVFYITVLPLVFWNFDLRIARMVITVWVVTM